ncbi:CvfB family protein [Paraliobacillus ryukyuensis]|uniref:CvfB family protein n=1 Tax=Paraliobacillus ryukyuensis TaxID=200904 RepID=UPI0009A6025B|nr:S1-like domain-containing RNA-binding protein [Paraliobacillus ryukyuensis]
MKKSLAGNIVSLQVKNEIKDYYVLSNTALANVYVNKENNDVLELNQNYQVFVYLDNDQWYGTTRLPDVQLDVFDWADVTRIVPSLGVFVDIGIAVDILVSKDDLPVYTSVWPEVEDQLYVTLEHDKKGRLLAKPVSESDFEGTWDIAPENLLDQSIEGRIFRTDREGAVMISDQGYRGFIHHTERKHEPRLGQWVNGRVIAVKEDGTVNVSLRPRKKEARRSDADMILAYLQDNHGEMSFNDKTDPTTIYDTFKISKAAFKRALGKLMKENKVKQQENKTVLLD